MKIPLIQKIIIHYKEWRLRQIRKKIAFKFLSNPNHNPDTYETTDLVQAIVEYITEGIVRD